MLRLDINLVFTIINLLIWYAIIRIFLFKPINKVIDKRSAAIQEKYDAVSYTHLSPIPDSPAPRNRGLRLRSRCV